MQPCCRLAGCALAIAVAIPIVGNTSEARKLKEADVLKLIELQIRDDAIIERIERSGLAFAIDEAVLSRFQKAGASDAVLAALRGLNPKLGAPPAAAPPTFMLWVKQDYNRDCPLQSEVSINGQAVDTFSSDASRTIAGRLKPGWNRIDVKTALAGSQAEWNKLVFQFGPVHKDPKSKKQVMEPVLWQFDNGTDWRHRDGKITHSLGPDLRDVTVSYNLYFADTKLERNQPKNGDYVLSAKQSYDRDPPVTPTVFINGTPLTSFIGQHRSQLVITSLLKAGKNEVRIVTHRAKNVIESNDMDFFIGGPAEYSVTDRKYVVQPVIQFKAITGWHQDKKSGAWSVETKPDAESFERTLTFNLDRAPAAK